jgi:pimeloyl-ACP methyl ester carboxylesterase
MITPESFHPEVPRTEFMNVFGAKIRYSDSGKGRVVVLLHGFLESLEIWFGNGFAQELSKHYRIVAIDLPGHGKSDCVGYVHRMERMAKVVKCVMDQLGLRRYTLIGHSMGGYVSLAFAEKYPEHVTGLCLFHSTAYADSEAKRIDRERAIRLVKKAPLKYTNALVTNLFALANVRYMQEEIRWMRKIASRTKVQGVVACLEGMKIRKDRTAILRYGKFPMLIIAGTRDNVLPYDSLQQLAGVNSKIKLLKLEKTGHVGFLEAREITLKKIKAFAGSTFRSKIGD